MSRKSVQRFCENDMHKNKDLKARRLDPFHRDALLEPFPARDCETALGHDIRFRKAVLRRSVTLRRRTTQAE
ncbi:hypothetical protein ABID26_001848 [Mesorhizobium shonense]|uniref:Transposase n=1 Tax=Mesorhizobium shonense TaxID=1209948 RepID=A0ABV2HPX6_9HYPH|nr:hypothetical protein [Mesorhizobium sp.]RWB21385.1 MAG: hypothetical protein EOQ40_11375 [Mesorhizobium sp.]TIS50851.1 MAG: hypothetical protein E5W96_04010 [Mesorhizobium sp.]